MDEARANDHEDPSKDEHEHEVCCSSAKGTLFKHLAMPVGEDYVEEEGEPDRAEIAEGGEQSPPLVLVDDEMPVEIQVEWGNEVQLH